ncbi:alpha/beta hydrolase family protein [Actinoplanes sp. NPDC049265]|uniref:alpha/beta hydrolase family protein n=1 Tax=Actinoplanes sp. NPDC049265 TaxID=3363902 RepID=UPI0037108D56
MRRRTLLLGLAAAGGLSACSPSSVPAPASSPSPSPVTGDIMGSNESSSLEPQSVTHYEVPAGSAPARAFPVGRRDFNFSRGTDRPLPTRVWYPAAGAPPASPAPADNAAPASGAFPLILFSHGLTSVPEDFAALLSRWAQAGFVVAGAAYPHTKYEAPVFDENDVVNQPDDAVAVIDQLLALTGDPLRAIVDDRRIAAAGHSGGAITTVGLFSARRDSRLKAGLAIAGTDFLSTPFTGPAAAMLFVHGTDDDTVKYEAGHTVFEAVPWSRAMLTIRNGGHVIEDSSFEPIARTSTEFWRWSLYGDNTARTRLPAAATAGDVADLEQDL